MVNVLKPTQDKQLRERLIQATNNMAEVMPYTDSKVKAMQQREAAIVYLLRLVEEYGYTKSDSRALEPTGRQSLRATDAVGS